MYAPTLPPSSCLTLTAQTLTVFLDIVLAKRYTNPSSEIITVLAGLDEVDDVFLDFANAVEVVIRTGRSGMFEEHVTSKAAGCIDSFAGPIRRKAVEVAIALTAGAYQTSLVSYFTHRDLFPCLMKVCMKNLQYTSWPKPIFPSLSWLSREFLGRCMHLTDSRSTYTT